MDQKIKELFNKGKTYKEIGKELEVSENTVYNHVKKMGLKRRVVLTDKEKQNIINRIKNGETYTAIAKDYKRDVSTISDIATSIGYKCKNNRNRKYNFNEDFFEVIDTEHKAYWLGFIVADGAVCKTDKSTISDANRLYINISNNDKELLNIFCDDLNYDKTQVKSYIPNESTYSNNVMCKLNINSTKICEDLKKYGIIKQKTGKEKFVLLDDALMPHFIRGFFDGDGTVYNTYQNGPRITHVGFSGNYIFLNNLKTYLKKQGIIKNNNKITQEKRNNCNCCSYSFANKKDIKSFFDYIYKDATVFLERKHNKFL